MADDHPTADPGEDEYGDVEGGEDEDGNANPAPPAQNASPGTTVETEEFAHANDDD